jgi:hypothetical protein
MSEELEQLTNNSESEQEEVTSANGSQEEEGLQEAQEVTEVLDNVEDKDNPEDDVRAAYELLTNGAKEEDEAKQANESDVKREARAKLFGKKSEPQKPQQEKHASEVAIPIALDEQERADFAKLPPSQQKAVKRILDSAAAKFTRTQQQLRESLDESEDVIKAIRPHMRKWGVRGMSPAQVITQLANAQEILTENRAEALIQLANEGDIDLAELAKQQRGEVAEGQQFNIEQHPKFRALQEKVDSFNNRFQQADQQQNSQAIESKASEVRRFAAERDALGGQKYQRLSDANFFQRWKQLVVKLGEITPEAEFTERLQTAYRTLAPNDFIASNPTSRLPAASNGRDAIARAKAANVSVRGAGGMSDLSSIESKQIPESAEDTARLAYEYLTGRQL